MSRPNQKPCNISLIDYSQPLESSAEIKSLSNSEITKLLSSPMQTSNKYGVFRIANTYHSCDLLTGVLYCEEYPGDEVPKSYWAKRCMKTVVKANLKRPTNVEKQEEPLARNDPNNIVSVMTKSDPVSSIINRPSEPVPNHSEVGTSQLHKEDQNKTSHGLLMDYSSLLIPIVLGILIERLIFNCFDRYKFRPIAIVLLIVGLAFIYEYFEM